MISGKLSVNLIGYGEPIFFKKICRGGRQGWGEPDNAWRSKGDYLSPQAKACGGTGETTVPLV